LEINSGNDLIECRCSGSFSPKMVDLFFLQDYHKQRTLTGNCRLDSKQ